MFAPGHTKDFVPFVISSNTRVNAQEKAFDISSI